MSPKKASYPPYSKDFIREVLKEYERGLSQKELIAKFKIGDSTLTEWLNRYGGATYAALKRSRVPASKKNQIIRAIKQNRMTQQEAAVCCKVQLKTIKTWLKEAARNEINSFEKNEMPPAPQSSQERELAAAQLKIRALETMIDIAEEKFKIAIRKKPGAKQ